MKEMSVGSKNQVVIPKEIRNRIKDFKPGKKVILYYLDNETIIMKVKNKNWINDTYGIMKESWIDIDPIKEINKMRSEWT